MDEEGVSRTHVRDEPFHACLYVCTCWHLRDIYTHICTKIASVHTPTHTHTDTDTLINAHMSETSDFMPASMFARVGVCVTFTHTHMHTRVYVCTPTPTHTNTHTGIHTHMSETGDFMPASISAHVGIYETHTHVYTHTCVCTHQHTHTPTHTPTHVRDEPFHACLYICT